MPEHKPNREYKASLFVDLFSEPEKLIELYNALSGKDYPSDTPDRGVRQGDSGVHQRGHSRKLPKEKRIGGHQHADAGMGYGEGAGYAIF